MDETSSSEWIFVNNIPNGVEDHLEDVVNESVTPEEDVVSSTLPDDAGSLHSNSSLETDLDLSFDVIEEGINKNKEGNMMLMLRNEEVHKSEKISQATQANAVECTPLDSHIHLIISLSFAILALSYAIHLIKPKAEKIDATLPCPPCDESHADVNLMLQRRVLLLENRLRLERQKYSSLLDKVKMCSEEKELRNEFIINYNNTSEKLDEIYHAISLLNGSVNHLSKLVDNNANTVEQKLNDISGKVENSSTEFENIKLSSGRIKNDDGNENNFHAYDKFTTNDSEKVKHEKSTAGNEQNIFMKKIDALKKHVEQRYSKAKKLIDKKVDEVMNNKHIGQILKFGSNLFSDFMDTFHIFKRDYSKMYKKYTEKFASPLLAESALPLFDEFKKIFDERWFPRVSYKQKQFLLCQYQWWSKHLKLDYNHRLLYEWGLENHDCSNDVYKWQKHQTDLDNAKKLGKTKKAGKINKKNKSLDDSSVNDSTCRKYGDQDEKMAEVSQNAGGEWYFRKLKPTKPDDTWYLWMLERSNKKKED